MPRVGSFATSQFILRQNLGAQQRAQDLRVQVSTGQKAQRYDGIAADVRRLEGLEKQAAAGRTFAKGIERTELRLEKMETSVDTLQDIASNFRTTLLSAANAENLDSIDVQKIAKDLRTEAAGELNAELAGRFLFAGSNTQTRPVDFEGLSFSDIQKGDYFKGNADILSVRANDNVEVDYGVTADPASDKGFHKLIQALSRIAEPDSGSVSFDDIQRSLRDLSGGDVQAVLTGKSLNLADPDTPLNDPSIFGAFTDNTLELSVAGGPTATVTIDATGSPGDTLRDVADKIDGLSGLSARFANEDGTGRLEVFSDSGAPVAIAGSAVTAGPFAAASDRATSGAIQELADTKSGIGSSLATLGNTLTRLEDNLVDVEAGISEIENVDLTRAMTLLAQEQTTLESSFAVTARLAQTSILNFL